MATVVLGLDVYNEEGSPGLEHGGEGTRRVVDCGDVVEGRAALRER